MSKVTAIYVRRSISDKDRDNNSLSIDSQIADCIKFLDEGEEHKVYIEDGKSAKNTKDRPVFNQMVSDAMDGLITRIVVKKYDRFSRNMRDYLNVTEDLLKYGVHIYSLTENFDTTTNAGRMMRNNLLNFAEFERATIADRVRDAYNTKAADTGFYQGGKVYYGYKPERRTVNGKNGSVLVPSDKANVIITAFRVYRETNSSLQGVVNYFKENEIDTSFVKKDGEKYNMCRSHISQLLKSPLYVRADLQVYQYLVSVGFEILDDVKEFDGIHGLFRHKRANGKEYIKVGYHEGLVDSDTWLAVQDKKSHNIKIPNGGNAINSWLVGLTKCPHCGYGFYIYYGWNTARTKQWRYYGDRGRYTMLGCAGKKRLKLKPDTVEHVVYNAMKERLEQLEIAKMETSKPDTETENMIVEALRIEKEINGYVDRMLEVKGAALKRLEERINDLSAKKTELEEKIRAKARKKKEVDTVSLQDPLSRWDSLTVAEKNTLAKTMIEVVYLSDDEGIDISFSI